MDRITATREKVAYAKVCVEVDVNIPIPRSLRVVLGGGVRVKVSMETLWLPLKCSKCCVFSHSDRNCPKKETNDVSQVWKPKQQSSVAKSSQDSKNQKAGDPDFTSVSDLMKHLKQQAAGFDGLASSRLEVSFDDFYKEEL
ncbi:hypothetical protein PTKIN_Ptkin06aG0123700 [Pterospermum kingtungense]